MAEENGVKPSFSRSALIAIAASLSVHVAIAVPRALSAPAASGDPYATGVKLLTARQFAPALQHFNQAIKVNPRNAMAYYYIGLAKHYQGDRAGAMEAYSKVVSDFSGSDACNLALRGMQSIDPTILQQLGLAGGGGGGRSRPNSSGAVSSGDDIVPNESRVNFTKEHNCMILDGRVNGRSTRMMFDTGAENVVLGMNHIRDMGLNLGKSTQSVNVFGTGSGGPKKAAVYNIELSVGNIIRKNFPVIVQDEMDNYPIIGQSFLYDLKFSVDNNNNSITFQKRTGQTSSQPITANDVPFERQGKELMVMTQVDGRNVPMWFDTGASWITFTQSQAQACGITVPDDAREMSTKGVAGTSRTRFTRVRSIKLGPVEKRDVEVGVVDHSAQPYPLLGGNFLQDQQYSIDYDRGVIHFGRH